MKKLQNYLVLIKVDPVEEKDASGVFIQEEWKTLPPTGTVVRIGAGVKFCKPGDHIFFIRYAAVQVDEDHRLCREEEVLAVL